MDSRFASRRARELADELALEPDAIAGSGRGGRITVADVRGLVPAAPDDLGEAGRALWRDVRAGWVLRPDEERLLLAACRTVDELERIDQALAAAEIVTAGSKGQDRAHPLLAEVRSHRLALRSLLSAIGIEDAEADAGSQNAQRSHAGRALARQRWSRRQRGSAA